ncbi:MAG: FHA domain-containing protein [Anaerolineae bacterium]|nr:FHA domain-containing protein [Anaerolineae bacterium]
MVSLDWILFGLRVLATVILYTFLGLAFYLIWRDLKRAESRSTAAPQLSDQLRIVAAAEGQALVVGQTFPLQSTTLLGYGPENTIIVSEADALTQQARLRHQRGVWWLENLGGEDTTKLNHAFLTQPAPLTNGDIIEIGDVCFKFEVAVEKAHP